MINKPIIILVAPQMGENIGAAARAMKNFDISELRIVAPRDGWPNQQARSMAVGAVNIIDTAKIYDNLESSIEDIEFLYATSAVPRDINKNYILSKELPGDYQFEQKVAIMFGRENCGLNNTELTLANKIITINTGEFSSLNIAQSIIIICYELFNSQRVRADLANDQQMATKAELGYFFKHLLTELEQKSFFKVPEKKPRMQQNIMNIFTRIDKLSSSELQTLRGMIASLSCKLTAKSD